MAAIGWEPDLIVVDEAHHAVAGSWAAILKRWPKAKLSKL
jgi:superfamily II DNA or RNA helicase